MIVLKMQGYKKIDFNFKFILMAKNEFSMLTNTNLMQGFTKIILNHYFFALLPEIFCTSGLSSVLMRIGVTIITN